MNEELTQDEALAVGVMSLCCCLVALAALIGLVVWLARRGKSSAPQQPAATMSVATGAFHLSVIALAVDGAFRPQLEQALQAAAAAMDPLQARLALVQHFAQALLGLAPQWRAFGYGEKDLGDLSAAQQSYSGAVADFRGRAGLPPDGGALCVLTLVLCTRGRRTGVDRLDSRQQVAEVLGDRLRLDAAALLGAEVIWAPPAGGLTELTLRQRFPEMLAVVQ